MNTIDATRVISDTKACKGTSETQYADLIITFNNGARVVAKDASVIDYYKTKIILIGTIFVLKEGVNLISNGR
jgi:hypothetical protein